MTKYLIRKAPIYYQEGIPASKAGEWPGIKSNKFENTRLMIQPLPSDIFNYTKTETINLPKRKLLGLRYSEEYKFKPRIKMVDIIKENKTLHKFNGELIPSIPEIKDFIPRKYYFQKVNDYHNEKEEKHNELIKKNIIINNNQSNEISFKPNILKTDYPKEFYDNISNNKLLGISFTKEIFQKLKNNNLPKIKNTNEFLENSKFTRKMEEGQKLYALKNLEDNRKKDMKYVLNLENWGNNYKSQSNEYFKKILNKEF